MSQSAFLLASEQVDLASEIDFEGWRAATRRLILSGVLPDCVEWRVGEAVRADQPSPEGTLRLPRRFVDKAGTVILHSDPARFSLLYKIAWRMVREPGLVHIASDPDMIRLVGMDRSVRRDIHKMHAFVRFREVDGRFYAWFEPAHFIVEHSAEFFRRRFTGMQWSILTPYRTCHWDGTVLSFGPGASKGDAPSEDASEDLWKTYYRNIFNPARVTPKAMQAQMPKKYWRNLPEAELIPELISGADSAARAMIARAPTLPSPHHAVVQAKHWSGVATLPAADDMSLAGLKAQAAVCRRCPLWCDATQTVFGEGPPDPQIMFVGEQPGDHEDVAGKPFVGPAGRVFDEALAQAGLDRARIYVTNAVKHFKYTLRGKRRIHAKPGAGEIAACKWWLERELRLTNPQMVVAMGATAAYSLLGDVVQVTKLRGQVIARADGLKVYITVHPAHILRIPEPDAQMAARAAFAGDLKRLSRMMDGGARGHQNTGAAGVQHGS